MDPQTSPDKGRLGVPGVEGTFFLIQLVRRPPIVMETNYESVSRTTYVAMSSSLVPKLVAVFDTGISP